MSTQSYAMVLALVVTSIIVIGLFLLARGERVRSRIFTSEAVFNSNRVFGSAKVYYPAYVRIDGKWIAMLFLPAEFDTPMDRAKKNPEDMPSRWSPITFWR